MQQRRNSGSRRSSNMGKKKLREIQNSGSDEERPDNKNMRQRAGRSSQSPSQRLSKAKHEKHQQRIALGQRTPPPEEENSKVKFKDCASYGHMSKSKRCPMKCWDGALTPQHLGQKKEKENLTPMQLEIPHDIGSFHQSERQKDQGQMQEEQQRKTLLQSFPEDRRLQRRQQPNWKGGTESSAFLRQTSSSQPIQVPCNTSVLGPVLVSHPPVKNIDERPTLPTAQHFQNNELDFYSIPVPMKGQEVVTTGSSQPALRRSDQNTAFHEKGADGKPQGFSLNVAQATSKCHGVSQVLHPQSTTKGPDVSKWPCLHTTAWRGGQVPTLSVRAPIKMHAQDPVKASQHAPKTLRVNPILKPQWSTGSPGMEVHKSLRFLPSTSGLRITVSPHVTRKTTPQCSSMDLQPPRKSPLLNSAPPCTKSNPAAASCIPLQSLRMVFRRLHHDCWSCRLITDLPTSPPTKVNAPAMSNPFLDKSEEHNSHVPMSFLYENLQVSSSSEDSDKE